MKWSSLVYEFNGFFGTSIDEGFHKTQQTPNQGFLKILAQAYFEISPSSNKHMYIYTDRVRLHCTYKVDTSPCVLLADE